MNLRDWSWKGNTASACTSIACMGSMGASLAAGASSAMAVMGALPASTPLLTQLLVSLGLGFLTRIPDSILQPLLILVLAATFALSYLTFRSDGLAGPFALTLIAGLLLYASIYAWFSESLYWLSFIALLAAPAWRYRESRK